MFELGIQLKEQRGEANVFDLSLGNPVMEPPPEFYQAAEEFIKNPGFGAHRYMPNAGYLATRQAIASSLSRETGLVYTPNHLVMSVGAGGGLNVVIHALCDPGDEVIVLTPYFAEYLFYVSNHGAIPIVAGCDRDFVPDIQDIASKVSSRTKAVLLNSPNNPSGVIYDRKFIAALAEVLNRRGAEEGTEIFLVSDEPYRKIIFDGLSYPFPQNFYKRTITVSSHSKDLALPGERIGYIAVNPAYEDFEELVDALVFCNRVLGFVNAPAFMQHVITSLQDVTVDVADYQMKRDFLVDALRESGYQVRTPEGAFYLFPESPVPDELQLIEALQRHGVLVVPGRGFGMPGFFRVSYCVNQWVLDGAIAGFAAAAEELR